jgi:hypothetical protein
MRRRASLGGLAIMVGVAACVNATSDVQGGDKLFDTAEPQPDAAAGALSCDIGADAGTGTTWTSLYTDFFGPSGAAKCSGDGTCHGDKTQAGAVSSGGYVCGPDKAACRASLLDPGTGLVQLPHDQADPSLSGLVQELRRRKPDGTVVGLMPKRPACIFEQAAIDRVQTWIKNGAPDD